MNKRQNKIITISFLVAVLCCSIFLILYALRDNVIFFYSPSEIEKKVSNGDIADGSLIRLGGLVLEDSFQRGEDNNVSFVITDLKNEINIAYSGILPDLFREGQGVIAEGYIEIIKVKNKDDILKKQLKFNASNILAKHDENYMPPEVSEALGLEY